MRVPSKMHNSAISVSPKHRGYQQAEDDEESELKDGVNGIPINPSSDQHNTDKPGLSHDDSDNFKELQEQMKAADEDGERMQRRIFALEVESEQVKLALKGAPFPLRLNSDLRHQLQQSFSVDEDLSPIKDMSRQQADDSDGREDATAGESGHGQSYSGRSNNSSSSHGISMADDDDEFNGMVNVI